MPTLGHSCFAEKKIEKGLRTAQMPYGPLLGAMIIRGGHRKISETYLEIKRKKIRTLLPN